MTVYDIDIVGTCNLKCAGCPVGIVGDLDRSKGFMEPDYFEKLVNQIASRHPKNEIYVELFNWGEPLLHPRIGDIIKVLKQHDINHQVSSNFNVHRNIRELVEAAPTSVRVSMSGASQEIYSRAHVGGDVRLVISNLYLLRHLMDKKKKCFDVEVHYHLYRDNLGSEIRRIADLAKELGFRFHPGEAFFMLPVDSFLFNDKIALLESKEARFIERMLVKPAESAAIRKKYLKGKDCVLRSNQFAINYDGSVSLCCAAYSSGANVSSNFLETPVADVQSARYKHEVCTQCFARGLAMDSYEDGSKREIRGLLARRVAEIDKQSLPYIFPDNVELTDYIWDEGAYLRRYHDVAEAIRLGQLSSGLQHYRTFGRAEGRSIL